MNDDNVWSSHQSVQKPEPKVLEQSESWTSPVRNGLEDDVWSTVDRSTLQAPEKTQIDFDTADLSEDEFGDFEDNIESSAVAEQTNKSIEQAVNEYIDDKFKDEAHGVEAYEVTEIPPLSIDSTRDVWTRLTTIKSRIVKYPGTNLEREVTTILTAWRTEQLTKTSWERPSTVHYSPSESLGAGLFGWGQPLSSEDQQKVVQHKRLSGSDFGSKAAVIVSAATSGNDGPVVSSTSQQDYTKSEIAAVEDQSFASFVDGTNDHDDEFGDFEEGLVAPVRAPKSSVSPQSAVLATVSTKPSIGIKSDPLGIYTDEPSSPIFSRGPTATNNAETVRSPVTSRVAKDRELIQPVQKAKIFQHDLLSDTPAPVSHVVPQGALLDLLGEDSPDIRIAATKKPKDLLLDSPQNSVGQILTDATAERPVIVTRPRRLTREEEEKAETVERIVSYLPDLGFLLP